MVAERLGISEAETVQIVKDILKDSFGAALSKKELLFLQMIRVEGLLHSLKPGVDEGVPAICRIWLQGLQLHKDLINSIPDDLEANSEELYFDFEAEGCDAQQSQVG